MSSPVIEVVLARRQLFPRMMTGGSFVRTVMMCGVVHCVLLLLLLGAFLLLLSVFDVLSLSIVLFLLFIAVMTTALLALSFALLYDPKVSRHRSFRVAFLYIGLEADVSDSYFVVSFPRQSCR